jgi:hypothetical protein
MADNNKRGLEGKHYIEKKKIKIIKTLNSMPNNIKCKCGRGEICIVYKRWLGEWVDEDNILIKYNLPVRKNCFETFNLKQKEVLNMNK